MVICAASAFVTMRMTGSRVSVTVPDVTGLALQDAREDLRRLGLELVVGSEESDSAVAKGHIVRQETAPGTTIKGESGGIVRVVVSRGLNPKRIPDVVGLTLVQARAIFKERSIVIDHEIEVHSDTVPEGQVLAEQPLPEQGAVGPVTVIASLGPADVTYYCPDFTGMSMDDASGLANALGVEVSAKAAEVYSGSLRVLTQNPPPGADIRRGGTIYLAFGGDYGR